MAQIRQQLTAEQAGQLAGEVNAGSIPPPELHYIVTGHAGSARELANEQGEVHWRGDQEIWGDYHQWGLSPTPKRYLEEASNDPVYCDLRYQGQLYDAESGLYYNRYRYYDPEIGQYLSPDPIGLLGGTRPQAYVHNPLEWVDPLGLVLGRSRPEAGWNYNNMPKIDGFQNHHVIPRSLKSHPALKAAGFDIDSSKNLIYLPKDRRQHPTRSVHNGWNMEHKDYNVSMKDQLDEIHEIGRKRGWSNAQYAKAVDDLIKNTRQDLRQGNKCCGR